MRILFALLILAPLASAAPLTVSLDFDGAPAFTWDNRTITAPPAFTGDRAAVLAKVRQGLAPFAVSVNADAMQPVTGKVLRVLVGGAGDWIPGVSGVTNLFEIYEPTPTAFVFPLDLNNDPRFVAFAIEHETGHALAGLEHQATWINSVKINDYRDNYIMGNPYTPAEPIWGVGIASSGVVQDDVAEFGRAVGLVPEPSVWMVCGLMLLGRRTRGAI